MKADEEERVRVPYEARNSEPLRPRVMRRQPRGEGEALTGDRASWVLSREIVFIWGAEAVPCAKGNTGDAAIARHPLDPTRSETPCTSGSSSYGNREIPCLAGADGAPVRGWNPEGARIR